MILHIELRITCLLDDISLNTIIPVSDRYPGHRQEDCFPPTNARPAHFSSESLTGTLVVAEAHPIAFGLLSRIRVITIVCYIMKIIGGGGTMPTPLHVPPHAKIAIYILH